MLLVIILKLIKSNYYVSFYMPILIQVFVFFGSVVSRAGSGLRSPRGQCVCQINSRPQIQKRYLTSCLSRLTGRHCGHRANARLSLVWLCSSPLKPTQEAFFLTLLGKRTPFPAVLLLTKESGSEPEV